MAEAPKRLTPTGDVVRELYLKSGNECAFEDCHERIVDEDGDLLGEIAHIEAAMPDGPRFNQAMTNDQRRAFSNLLLLCRKHHEKTHNAVLYPVDRMRQMKAKHEARFTDAVERIRSSFVDHTKESVGQAARSGEALNEAVGWDLSPEELAVTIESVNSFFKRFDPVPAGTREFAAVVVDRGRDHDGYSVYPVVALYHDVVEACEASQADVNKHIQILEHHGMGYFDENDGVFQVGVTGPDWPMWADLREFSRIRGFDLRELIVAGRLELLD